MTATLFQPDAPPTPAMPAQPHAPTGAFVARDYQAQDVDAILAAWESGKRGVVCRWSTGLGKSFLAAEIARIMSAKGRVLIMVDVGSLARDLYKTLTKHTGMVPASLTGKFKSHWREAQIVTATVQTLYAGGEGKERFRDFDPLEFSCVIVDECETAIAKRYGDTIRYFVSGNDDLKLVGMTATPFRTDKRGMGEIFDHAENESGVLNRDILWSVMNGWLVKPRQGFVRCSLDFSTIKVRKNDAGEKDYSEDDVAKLMMNQDEIQWRQMAEAIYKASDGRQSIIICPNSVEVAKAVAYHIDGAAGKIGIANPIFGAQGEQAHDLIASFKKKEFQFAVSCNMLYKGFDDEFTQCVFMLRKTKSRRLYEQSLGRAVRPPVAVREALNAEPDAEKRVAMIAASTKPYACMFDLVGVHADAKDLGVIDVLGEKVSERLRERAKQDMLNKAASAAAEADAEFDVGAEARESQATMKKEIEIAHAALLRKQAEDAERKKRYALEMKSTVEIEMSDDMGARGKVSERLKNGKKRASEKQINMLVALGVHPTTATGYSTGQAFMVIKNRKEGGASWDWSKVRAWERRGKPLDPVPKQPRQLPPPPMSFDEPIPYDAPTPPPPARPQYDPRRLAANDGDW